MKPLGRAGRQCPWLAVFLLAVGAPALVMAANGPGAAADSGSPGAAATAEAADPLQWLEDVHGERAMAWVKTENDKTLAVLERDPRFSAMYGQALAISEARDRIPYPDFNRHAIFNFWQDEQHSRGLWRRTTLESYRSPAPHWTSVLNLDALAASESANWVWEGADCLRPVQQRCLVSLSDGGEDAVTVREFDLATLQFVSDGFVLPTSKQDATWIDADHLLVSRDWGPGTLTASGYPYVVKALARGEDISKAQEVFRGQPDDVGVVAWGLEDGAGHRVTLITRYLSFFESEVYVVGANGPKRLNIPKKASVDALVANRLLITLKEP